MAQIANLPSTKVSNVTEILEHILSFLPPEALLRCQAVSRKWHSLILDSRLLQEALFQKPAAPKEAWVSCYEPTDYAQLDETQVSRPGYSDDPPRSSYRIAAVVPAAKAEETARALGGDKVCVVAKLNTLLLSHDLKAWQSEDLNLRAANGEGAQLRIRNSSAILTGSQTTLGMFLTQPPAKHVAVTIFGWVGWDESEREPRRKVVKGFRNIVNEAGVTYGDLLSFVLDVEEGQGLASVNLDIEGVVFASEQDVEEAERQAWIWAEAARAKRSDGPG